MDYKLEGVYCESDISGPMFHRKTNRDYSMTNPTTCNLVKLIESVGGYNRYQGINKGD